LKGYVVRVLSTSPDGDGALGGEWCTKNKIKFFRDASGWPVTTTAAVDAALSPGKTSEPDWSACDSSGNRKRRAAGAGDAGMITTPAGAGARRLLFRKLDRQHGGNCMESVIGLIVTLALLAVLFLVFRAIVLWYWRVNEAVTLLKSIDEKLGRMAAAPRAP
jgi:hypothetical protein